MTVDAPGSICSSSSTSSRCLLLKDPHCISRRLLLPSDLSESGVGSALITLFREKILPLLNTPGECGLDHALHLFSGMRQLQIRTQGFITTTEATAGQGTKVQFSRDAAPAQEIPSLDRHELRMHYHLLRSFDGFPAYRRTEGARLLKAHPGPAFSYLLQAEIAQLLTRPIESLLKVIVHHLHQHALAPPGISVVEQMQWVAQRIEEVSFRGDKEQPQFRTAVESFIRDHGSWFSRLETVRPFLRLDNIEKWVRFFNDCSHLTTITFDFHAIAARTPPSKATCSALFGALANIKTVTSIAIEYSHRMHQLDVEELRALSGLPLRRLQLGCLLTEEALEYLPKIHSSTVTRSELCDLTLLGRCGLGSIERLSCLRRLTLQFDNQPLTALPALPSHLEELTLTEVEKLPAGIFTALSQLSCLNRLTLATSGTLRREHGRLDVLPGVSTFAQRRGESRVASLSSLSALTLSARDFEPGFFDVLHSLVAQLRELHISHSPQHRLPYQIPTPVLLALCQAPLLQMFTLRGIEDIDYDEMLPLLIRHQKLLHFDLEIADEDLTRLVEDGDSIRIAELKKRKRAILNGVRAALAHLETLHVEICDPPRRD